MKTVSKLEMSRALFRLASCAAFAALVLFLPSSCASSSVCRAAPESILLAEAKVDVSRLVEAMLADGNGMPRPGESAAVSLSGAWKDRPFAAECVLKRGGDSLVAVFLAPQMRLATLKMSRPHAIEWDAAPSIPSAFRPEYAIFDLAVARLPVDALRRSLGDGMAVVEGGGAVRVFAGAKAVAARTRLRDGGVKVENFLWGYEYMAREMK